MKRYLAGALLLLLLAVAAPLRADEHPARPGRPSDANITGHVVDARTGEEMCRCATVMVCYSLSARESADIPEEYRRAIAACEGESVFSTPEINPTT